MRYVFWALALELTLYHFFFNAALGHLPLLWQVDLWELASRQAEIWDFENHEFGTFQSPISQLAYIRSSWKIFWRLSHDWSPFGILWFMSRLLTSFEISDMAETMEIQKWHFHCPWSPKWLGFGPWPIKTQLISGLSLFTIPDLVDFHSEGAEILKVENHKREALL